MTIQNHEFITFNSHAFLYVIPLFDSKSNVRMSDWKILFASFILIKSQKYLIYFGDLSRVYSFPKA